MAHLKRREHALRSKDRDDRDFVLPIKRGGLGLRLWKNEANVIYQTSKTFIQSLQNHIKRQNMELPHSEQVIKAKDESISTYNQAYIKTDPRYEEKLRTTQ